MPGSLPRPRVRRGARGLLSASFSPRCARRLDALRESSGYPHGAAGAAAREPGGAARRDRAASRPARRATGRGSCSPSSASTLEIVAALRDGRRRRAGTRRRIATVRNTVEERLANAEPALRLLFGGAQQARGAVISLSSAADFAYGNTRLRARKAELLGAAEYEALLGRDLDGVLEFLAGTAYRAEIEAALAVTGGEARAARGARPAPRAQRSASCAPSTRDGVASSSTCCSPASICTTCSRSCAGGCAASRRSRCSRTSSRWARSAARRRRRSRVNTSSRGPSTCSSPGDCPIRPSARALADAWPEYERTEDLAALEHALDGAPRASLDEALRAAGSERRLAARADRARARRDQRARRASPALRAPARRARRPAAGAGGGRFLAGGSDRRGRARGRRCASRRGPKPSRSSSTPHAARTGVRRCSASPPAATCRRCSASSR